jgi:hypothetical protein
MTAAEAKEQARREALYCERILAKSGLGVVTAALVGATPVAMQHYPAGDSYDPESGAQVYYHCHPPAAAYDEHGHFHCFLRPAGAEGPIHHLVAMSMNRAGRLTRLFTVNRWVTGDDWRGADDLTALLPRFDLQLATPDYLVNRWLTAVMARYRDEIAALLHERDRAIAARGGAAILEDRAMEILSECPVDLAAGISSMS